MLCHGIKIPPPGRFGAIPALIITPEVEPIALPLIRREVGVVLPGFSLRICLVFAAPLLLPPEPNRLGIIRKGLKMTAEVEQIIGGKRPKTR